MQFKDIVGQESVKERLISSVKNNKISHAQLFFGSEGTGKLSLAIAYAQYISCQNKSDTDSCGECNSCKKYNKLVHPDLHFVFPVAKFKTSHTPVSDDYIVQWRDFVNNNPYFTFNQWLEKMEQAGKQALIYEKESGEIIKKLNFKTFEAEYKIMIIWMSEKMNISAANKLLKIIEEPPPKTLFILISEDSNSLLSTIISRTQPINIPLIKKNDLYNYIVSKYNLPQDEINSAINYSKGSLIDLEKFVNDSETNKELFEIFTEYMRAVYKFNIEEINTINKKIIELGREGQKEFLLLCNRIIRENFILNIQLEEIAVLTKTEHDFSVNFSKFINPKNVEKIYEEFNIAYNDILRNANPKILFLDLSIKLTKLLRLN